MKNLAPHIYRQRMVIEGWRSGHLSKEDLVPYLYALSDRDVMNMRVISIDVSDSPYGPAAMCHWDYSGVAVMVWHEPYGQSFVSVDIHSCKPYEWKLPLQCTIDKLHIGRVAWQSVLPELATRPKRLQVL